LKSNAVVKAAGRCPHCGSERVYLEKDFTEPQDEFLAEELQAELAVDYDPAADGLGLTPDEDVVRLDDSNPAGLTSSQTGPRFASHRERQRPVIRAANGRERTGNAEIRRFWGLASVRRAAVQLAYIAHAIPVARAASRAITCCAGSTHAPKPARGAKRRR